MENEIKANNQELRNREAMLKRLAEICKMEQDPNFRGSSDKNKKEVRNILDAMAKKDMLTVQQADRSWEPLKKIEGKTVSTGPKTYIMARLQPQSEPYLLALDMTGKLLNASEKPVTADELVDRTSGLKKPQKPGFLANMSKAFGIKSGVDAVSKYESEKAEYDVGRYYALTNAGFHVPKPDVLVASEEADRKRAEQVSEQELQQELDDLAESLERETKERELARQNNEQANPEPENKEPEHNEPVNGPSDNHTSDQNASDNNEPDQEKKEENPLANNEEPIVFEPDKGVNDANAEPVNGDDLFSEDPQIGENNLFDENENPHIDDLFSEDQQKNEQQPEANNQAQNDQQQPVAEQPQAPQQPETNNQAQNDQQQPAAEQQAPQQPEANNQAQNEPQPAQVNPENEAAGEPILNEELRKAGPQLSEDTTQTEALKKMTGNRLITKSLEVLNSEDDPENGISHEETLKNLSEKGYLYTMDAKQKLVPTSAEAIGQKTFVIQEPGTRKGCVCFKGPQNEATGKSQYCCTGMLKQSEFQKINAVNQITPDGKTMNKGEVSACLQVMQSEKTNSLMKDVAMNRLKDSGHIQTMTLKTLGKNDTIRNDMPYMVKVDGQPGGYLFSHVGGVNCMKRPMSARTFRRAVASVVAPPTRPNAFYRFVNGVSKAFGGRGLKRCRDYDRARTLYRRKLYNAQVRAGYKVNKPADVEDWERTMLTAAYLASYDKIRIPNFKHPFCKKLLNSRKFNKFVKSPAAKEFLAQAHRMAEQHGGVYMSDFIRHHGDLLDDVRREMDGKKPLRDWTKKEAEKTEPEKKEVQKTEPEKKAVEKNEPTKNEPTKTEPEKEETKTKENKKKQEEKNFVPENKEEKKPTTPEERKQRAKEMRQKMKQVENEKTMERFADILPEESDKSFVDRMDDMLKNADGPRLATVLRDLTPESMIHLRDAWKNDPEGTEKSIKMMEHPEKVLMNNLHKIPQKTNAPQAEQGISMK